MGFFDKFRRRSTGTRPNDGVTMIESATFLRRLRLAVQAAIPPSNSPEAGLAMSDLPAQSRAVLSGMEPTTLAKNVTYAAINGDKKAQEIVTGMIVEVSRLIWYEQLPAGMTVPQLVQQLMPEAFNGSASAQETLAEILADFDRST